MIDNLLLLFLFDLFTHLGDGAQPLDHFFVAVVAVDFNLARFTLFVIEIELVDPIQFAVVSFRNFFDNRTEKGFTCNDQIAFALAFLQSGCWFGLQVSLRKIGVPFIFQFLSHINRLFAKDVVLDMLQHVFDCMSFTGLDCLIADRQVRELMFLQTVLTFFN